MPNIPEVSAKYGAPHGRSGSWVYRDTGTITLQRVELDSGGYDEGGAYWGLGEPLWWASSESGLDAWYRAKDLAAAQAQWPGATFDLSGCISDFARGAIEAAFFTSDPLPQSGEYSLDWFATFQKLHAEDQGRFLAACTDFEARYAKLLERACVGTGRDMASAGRDYHYTSAGHGVGYWETDRWGAFSELLDEACKEHPLPEIHAELDCHTFRECGEGCGECDACVAGPSYDLE